MRGRERRLLAFVALLAVAAAAAAARAWVATGPGRAAVPLPPAPVRAHPEAPATSSAPASMAAAAPPPAAALPESAEGWHERVLALLRLDQPLAARGALDELERLHPGFFAANGLDYLAAVLANRTGDPEAAAPRLRRVVATAGPLADRAAVRLARLLERERPAEGLRLVTGFARRFPASAVAAEARLLEVVLRARSGDAIRASRLAAELPRRLRRAAGHQLFALAREAGPPAEARRRARAILRGGDDDQAAYEAAAYLTALGHGGVRGLEVEERWALARALYAHRRFAPAQAELSRVAQEGKSPRLRSEALFLLGRAAMKAGDDDAAVRAFTTLAFAPGPARERALYQLARVALACGDGEQAESWLRQLEVAAPASGLAAEARLKILRLQTGAGAVNEARRTLASIVAASGPGSRLTAAAALDVAAAALAQGDAAAALADLDRLQPRDDLGRRQLGYWRGVALAQLGRREEAEKALHAAASGRDLIAALARRRLGEVGRAARPAVTALLAEGREKLAGGDAESARKLALTALEEGAAGAAEGHALRLLEQASRAVPAYQAAYHLALPPLRAPRREPPPRSWRGHAAAAADLRFLGLDGEAADELRAQSPARRSLEEIYEVAELAARGGDPGTAMLYADLLRRRLPPGIEPAWLPAPVLRLLYPDPYGPLVEAVAHLHGVDPDLLRAIMREESRFDPGALSPAGARGLMQFIPETARRVGESIGIDAGDREAVHDPAVAIPLGAAYVRSLLQLFAGNEGVAVAAYNAGEEVASEWLRRTGRGDLDEFLGKIEFAETRTYVDRVLTSLSAYRARRHLDAAD